MGLLAVITVYVLYLAPRAVAAYSDSKREDRDHLSELMKTIQQDRHADRNASHQQLMAYQIELKEQRQHDEAKFDRLIHVINEHQRISGENQQLVADALHRLEESNRNLASAIREIGKH